MNFTDFAAEGISKIYKEDLDAQKHFLSTVCSVVRDMNKIDSLLEAEAFFVPNNDYMLKYFGSQASDLEYDMYTWDGHCVWDNHIVFPVKNVTGSVVGFAGFDVVAKAKVKSGEGDGITSYYRYSSKTVFNRGKYLYCIGNTYEKAIRDGYIVIVDGMFDTHSLHMEDVNTGGALGSSLSDELVFQLRFIDTVFVAEDNDKAGRRLYEELHRKHPKVRFVRQNQTKDADDIVKSDYRQVYLQKLRQAIYEKDDLTLRIKPKFG